MQKLDYLIVGGGLAGAFSAFHLRKRKKSFLLVSHPSTPSSSKIAAGTWNPIAFKRFVLSWRAKEFLAEMEEQYPELEKLLDSQFYEKIVSKKLITEGDELSLWKKQAIDEEMKKFMCPQPQKCDFPKNFYLGEIKQTGRVSLSIFLKKFEEMLSTENSFLEENFNYQLLEKKNDNWHYKNYSFDKVIFCEGAHYINNPFFNWLPLKPAKGDIITIAAPQLKIDYILKKNIFILPLGGGKYEVGATYDWNNLNWDSDPTAIEQLKNKLKKVIPCDFEVIDTKAGIRPTSYDRRIIMGEHPEEKGLFIFNGLGTKGVLLAPLASKEFIEFLEDGKALNEEMDIKRCSKYFPN